MFSTDVKSLIGAGYQLETSKQTTSEIITTKGNSEKCTHKKFTVLHNQPINLSNLEKKKIAKAMTGKLLL